MFVHCSEVYYSTQRTLISQPRTVPCFHWLTVGLYCRSWVLKTGRVSRVVACVMFTRSLSKLHCSFQQWKPFCTIHSTFNNTVISESPSVAKKTTFPIDAILKNYKMAQKGTPNVTSQPIIGTGTFHRVRWTGLLWHLFGRDFGRKICCHTYLIGKIW